MKRPLTALVLGACLALTACATNLQDTAAPIAQEASASPGPLPSTSALAQPSGTSVDSRAVLLPEPFAVAVPATVSTPLTPLDSKNGRGWYAVLRTPPGQGATVVSLLASHADQFGFDMSAAPGRAWGRHVPASAGQAPAKPMPSSTPTPTAPPSARPSAGENSPSGSASPAPFTAPFRGDVKRTPATPAPKADAWVDIALMVVQAGPGVPSSGGDYVTVAFGTTNP